MGETHLSTYDILLMNTNIIIHLTSQLLWLILMLSLPTVLVASLVGLLVSLLQSLTQLQDQTIQFLAKLIAVSITIFTTYHWMGYNLLNYAELSFNQISKMS